MMATRGDTLAALKAHITKANYSDTLKSLADVSNFLKKC